MAFSWMADFDSEVVFNSTPVFASEVVGREKQRVYDQITALGKNYSRSAAA